MRKTILVPCRIERGGFISERTFQVDLPDRQQVTGVANVTHLRDENRQPLNEQNEPDFGEHIDGFVECRIIRRIPDQSVLVEFPGSEIVDVNEEVFRQLA